MKSIKYNSGELSRDGEYYNLVLFLGSKEVYKATLTREKASELINKSTKIKLK